MVIFYLCNYSADSQVGLPIRITGREYQLLGPITELRFNGLRVPPNIGAF